MPLPPRLSLRGATPERAEFENCSVVDALSEEEALSEIDEDEWTDRNLLSTCETLSGADSRSVTTPRKEEKSMLIAHFSISPDLSVPSTAAAARLT